MRSRRVGISLRGRQRARDEACPASRRRDGSSAGGQERDMGVTRRRRAYTAVHEPAVRQVQRASSEMGAAQEDGSNEAASSLRGRPRAYAARRTSESASCQRGCTRACGEVD
jgi:hypothetical protein